MAPPSASSSASAAATTSVQVALRIRPSTSHDASSIPPRFQRSVIHAATPTSVSVDPVSTPSSVPGSSGGSPSPISSNVAAKKQLFTFDQVHGPSTTQHAIFTTTAYPLISRFVEGFNCTILAYGQTSSGKTFTMTGIDLDADPADAENGMGIIPRAVSTIFTRARELKEERGSAWSYSLKGSFIEIYNEDLIDLLVVDEYGSGGRRDVQIREDKHGHIIWDGLREVGVKNPVEVMSLLRKGTSIRRTNETEMNAQSSRSHAIFSLTLTQKKYTGTSPPPVRSSSPLPPTGRSPSRLARASMYAGPSAISRASSPTFGRPSTPSFVSAIGRNSQSGLRPPSSMGNRLSDGRLDIDNGDGEWVTIVSKFHFVDLAGSERLKRTAAQGERIKEGISINSGLLALGNVISALGDPARAKNHTASYVPYRDSKLTRLLQDSLGGNAHTLMIACVSPAEWNAGETINTLKYANRARNIKNRAVLNEREEGWDDVEWLQGMVTRLRKEVKSIRDGGIASGTLAIGPAPSMSETSTASGKVIAQMVELQNNYEDLREQFTERTEELTRLRRQLADRRSSNSSGGGMSKYEEIVGPVIEEYEKTISAMEAELSLNRAALRHTNEMVEEKDDELSALSERHAATELYVEELRARAARLTEREASTEAYVRDLEEKVKQYDETTASSSESMSDLKREIARYRGTESHSAQYIADLEARLARSDESIIGLQQTIEILEKESERKRDEVERLQFQLETLMKDAQGWRDDLAEREQRVKELELKMQEWESKKREAGEERLRLGDIVDEVAKARQSLQSVPHPIESDDSQSESPASHGPSPTESTQLVALQQTHTATLADLSSVTSKYRDALREIHDLSSQLQEAKIVNSVGISDFPERGSNTEAPIFTRRRLVRNGSENGKRLFFRQAASAESLYSRYTFSTIPSSSDLNGLSRSQSQSQSLSQELSSVNLRKTSISSHGSSSSMSHSPSSEASRPNLSISLPFLGTNGLSPPGKSITCLEKEIMRLQDVLKDREAEIALLEESLTVKEAHLSSEPNGHPGFIASESFVSAKDDLNEDTNSAGATTPVNGASDYSIDLSPRTMGQFHAIRRSIDTSRVDSGGDGPVALSDEDSSQRLNELMRSMAQKESSHREIVDDLNEQLYQIRKQHDELATLSRDQIHNMSAEIEALHGRHAESLCKLEDMEVREAKLLDSLKRVEADHAAAMDLLRSEHEDAMRSKEAEVDDLLTRLKEEHQVSMDSLRDQLARASIALDQAHKEHTDAFGKLKIEHEETLNRRSREVKDLLEGLETVHQETLAKAISEHQVVLGQKDDDLSVANCRIQEIVAALETAKKDHEVVLSQVVVDHAKALKLKDEELSDSLQRTEEEYYNALTKLRTNHAEALEKQSAETSIVLERLKEEYAGQLRIAEIAKEGSLSETQSATEAAMRELKEAHARAISQKEANFNQDLEKLKADHCRAFTTTTEEHNTALARARSEHAAALSKVQEESHKEIERLASLLEESKASSLASCKQICDEMETALQSAKEQHEIVLRELQGGHQGELERLSTAHRDSLREAGAQATESERALITSHMEQLEELKVQHEATISEVQSTLTAIHARERQDVEDQAEQQRLALVRSHTKEISNLTEKHQSAITNADVQFERERASLVDQHVEEVRKLKAEHQSEVALVKVQLEQQHSALLKSHTEEMMKMKADHLSATAQAQSALIASREEHLQMLEDARVQSEQILSQEQEQMKASLAESETRHSKDHDTLQKAYNSLADEVATYKAASEELIMAREVARSQHEVAISDKDGVIDSVRKELANSQRERDDFGAEVARLQAELDLILGEQTKLLKEASKRESLVEELEKHRSVLAETQSNLQRTKDEKDILQAEKERQESLVRDLQFQIARSPSPPLSRSTNERFTRQNSLPQGKLPPPTPPPSVPPPPTPRVIIAPTPTTSSPSPIILSMGSVKDMQIDSPATSLAPSLVHDVSISSVDIRVLQQVDQQTKLIGEQETMIRTLNKQLTHCETDLQTHMDLVSTLETSLGDSEKNLRKARMHATELARERDSLNVQLTSLRSELTEAKREVQTVRKSVVEEKQSLENRLDEERRAKERVRAQLDSRVEELQKRKSKFVCL